MKILISACHFTPDPIGVGKFSGEMAEWLAARGHDVRAVVGVPFYPHWKVADGYSAARYRSEYVRGVQVLRCPIYVPSQQSGMKRLLQYAVLVATASLPLWKTAVSWQPDVVWTVMPPLAGMPSALVAARLAGAPSWLHVQDFEIDAAFELGILKSPGTRRFFLAMERKLMSAFSVISSITPRMLEKLDAKGVSAKQVLFPNWADLNAIFPMPESHALRDELGIGRQQFVALYSGNLGEKQGVDDLIDVARRLSHHPQFTLIVCGDGAGRNRLALRAEGLSNVKLLPLQPMERFNAMLNTANVHLLPQRKEVADLVMPSKLPGLLASGRPVIAGASPRTQLAQEVEGCGIVVPPGDVAAMADAVAGLMSDPARCASLGSAANLRARAHWSKDSVLERFETELLALAGR